MKVCHLKEFVLGNGRCFYRSNIHISRLSEGLSRVKVQSAEWSAALPLKPAVNSEIRVQRQQTAFAFGLGHHHQMLFPPRFFYEETKKP